MYKTITTLLTSLLFALLSVILTYHLLSYFNVSESINIMICSIIFSGIPFIHRVVEEGIRILNKNNNDIIDIDNYGMHFISLIIYGTLILCSFHLFVSILGGFLASTLGNEDETAFIIGIFLNPIFLILGLIVVGFYIGKRYCVKNNIFIILMCISLLYNIYSALILFLSPFYLNIDKHPILKDVYTGTRNPISWIITYTFAIITYTVILYIGVYFGKKYRLSSYLKYLLKNVNSETRNTIIELAHEEAVKYKNIL